MIDLMKKIPFIIALAGLLLGCCKENPPLTKIKKLDVPGHLTGRTITLPDRIIMPLKIFIIGDKLLVEDYTQKEIFKVFRLPEYQFLYSWGFIGEGPEEYIHVNPESTSISNGTFEFLDLGKIRSFKLDEEGPVELDIRNLPSLGSPANNLEKISDSIYIANTPIFSDDEYEHMVFDLSSNKIIKKFGRFPEEKIRFRSQNEKHIAFHTSSTANNFTGRYASFYTYFKRFKIYQDNGELLNEVVLRPDGEKKYSIKDAKQNIIYFAEPYSSNSYIYVLLIGKSVNDLESDEEDYNPILTIWNWNGNPVAQYKLNKPVTSFTISEERQTLYGVSYLKMDELYEFKLPDSLFRNKTKYSFKKIENELYKTIIFSDWMISFEGPAKGVLNSNDSLIYSTTIFADTASKTGSSLWINVISAPNGKEQSASDYFLNHYDLDTTAYRNFNHRIDTVGSKVITYCSFDYEAIDPLGVTSFVRFSGWIWEANNILYQVKFYTSDTLKTYSDGIVRIVDSFVPRY